MEEEGSRGGGGEGRRGGRGEGNRGGGGTGGRGEETEKEIHVIREGREWGGERDRVKRRCWEKRRRVTSMH